jgi:hypothetical protein
MSRRAAACVRRSLAAGGIVCALVGRAEAQNPPDAAACVQASEQGQTERDEGKYRAARKSFLACSRDACPALVVRSCANWLRELDTTAPTIVVGARDDHGSDLSDVTVTFDGAPFASHLDGRPIEVDSGEHVLRFEREGSEPVEQKLVIRAGERARVVTVTLRSPSAEVPPTPPTGDEQPAPPEPFASPRHIVAAALAVGALGAGGAGLAFTLMASNDQQDASNLRGSLPANACMGSGTPSCQALADKVSSQHDAVNTSTGFFIAAGALAVGAVATWFLWPSWGGKAKPPVQGGVVPSPSGVFFTAFGSLP